MIGALGPAKTRDIMKAQEFDLPKLFTQKADAVSFLHDNGLWLLQPGLAVTAMVEPKLKVCFLFFPCVGAS